MQYLHDIKIGALSAAIDFAVLFLVSILRPECAVSSDEFPAKPVLRIETRMHTTLIERIDVDRDQRFIVSSSLDKTVRIWDLESGRLLHTLRVPIGYGYLGRVLGVAISPDANSVAVGGWTGVGINLQRIFIFNRKSGAIKEVISGLPDVIRHLTYSPDGSHLVATIGGLYGIRVYETQTYSQVHKDSNYGNRSNWADFDDAGRLVTTSYDGYIRLYDKSFVLIQKKQAPGGSRPFSAVFSPDGRSIAVGYTDTTRVDVLSAESLDLRFSADISGTNGELSKVAWSKDGRYLYAGGKYNVAGTALIRRWSDAGRGSNIEYAVGNNTIMGIKPLSNGGLAVGTQDPSIAVLSADGKPIWKQLGGVADFRNQSDAKAMRLSFNGKRVRFGYEPWGKRPAQFSIDTWQLALDPPEDDRLKGPLTKALGIEITDWQNRYTPRLNGKLLALDYLERSRSLAIAPDHQHFLLGTEWRLRLFHRAGKQLWRVASPATAWTVNISGGGKLAIAAYSDGTLRWYRLSDGQELLALFAHKDGRRWIAWTPQGFYHASAGAEDLIGWHINHGKQKAPGFYGASRFRNHFYRPDVVARVLDTLDVYEALAQADRERGAKTAIKDVKNILPPTIAVLDPVSGTQTESTKIKLTYKAESSTGPITAVETRLNGRPFKPISEVILSEDKQWDHHIKLAIVTVEVPPEDSVITLIAQNRHGKSDPETYLSNWSGRRDWYKPDLYVLAVGVSNYNENHLRLKYAAKDARDFANAIQKQEGGLYKKVTVRLLDDRVEWTATREEILDGLDWLERKTKARDVAIVFLSGHGFNDERGKYNFLPFDYDPARRKRTTVHDYELEDFMSAIAGKTVLFFDTCHSGNVVTGVKSGDQSANVDKFANELADAGSGVIVFTSSTGKQFSIERDKWENGAFTEALLEGINSRKADYQKDWYVSIAELEVYVSTRVSELTNGKQKPMTAKPKAVEDYKIIKVRQGSNGG